MKVMVTHIQKADLNTKIIVTNHINYVPLGGWIVLELDATSESLAPIDLHGPYADELEAIDVAQKIICEIDELCADISRAASDDLPF